MNKNFIKKEKTNNLILRFIGNVCGSIFTFFLIREIKAENKNHIIRPKMFAKVCNPFGKAQNKWATYYI
jgi:formate/nitrite transporter FocA (FNT family)